MSHFTFKMKPAAGWLSGLLLLLGAPAAQAQLNAGTYTINPAGSGATNFTTFTAAVTALNVAGGTGNVTFLVSPGNYAESVPAIRASAGGSATRSITFQEAVLTPSLADNPVIVPPGSTSATDAGITLTSADYVTFDGININGSAVSTVEYGYLVRNTATDGAKNNIIRNARITLNRTNTTSAGLFQTASTTGGGATATTSPGGVNQNNEYYNLVIENVYKGIYLLTGNTTNFGFDANTSVHDNVIGASVATAAAGSIGNSTTTTTAGIQAVRQNALRVYNNEVQNVTVAGTTGYGISIEAAYGLTEVYANRIPDIRNTSTTSTSTLYGLRLDVAAVGTNHEVRAYNNFVYGLTHAFAGTASSTVRTVGIVTNQTTSTVAGTSISLQYNSVRMENLPTYRGSSVAYSQNLTTGPVLTVRNNIFADFSPAQTGVAKHYAIDSETATQFGPAGSVSDNNDLYVANAAAGQNGFVGLTGTTDRLTLANWRTAVNKDANSVSADPGFLAPTNLHASSALINDLAAPSTVTVDIDGQARSTTTPDIGADEFAPITDDVAVVSIDAPGATAVPGLNPVQVTIRNLGTSALTSVTLQYVLNSDAPVVQTFTGLSLATGATQQLTFSTSLLALSGSNTLTVTGSQPNGNAHGNANNDTQTITFVQPTPNNDEPCGAVTLFGPAPVNGSNSGAGTSVQNGIVTPACSPAQLPRDVWFAFTPTGSSTTLTLTGSAAGMVRVFESADCANGPFNQVFCQGSGNSNTSVGTVTVTGLTAGQRYYVAVSGSGSGDAPGSFTISGTALGSRSSTASTQLSVYPNPSATGQLTLRVVGNNISGTAELLNALGQLVRSYPLTGATEHELRTSGMAAGIYTLQVKLGQQMLSRKVVLE